MYDSLFPRKRAPSWCKLAATDANVEDAARRANAHELIISSPERYDTFIDERGVKLSGGQQQRPAIARAILASPQILRRPPGAAYSDRATVTLLFSRLLYNIHNYGEQS